MARHGQAMPAAEATPLHATIHVVDQKVDRLALGVVDDFQKAHDKTQGAFEDLRAYSEFLADRGERHTTAEVGSLRVEMNARFDQVDQRFDQVDQRFNRIDQRFNQIERRFNQIERRFDRLEERLFRKRK